MQSRALHRILAAALVILFALPAIAQFTRDASANKKIDEAINQHYLMMELDKAENLLTGVVDACELKCKPATKAKAWMYVGVIRGSGRNDQAGAADAFKTAKSFDPQVKLDEALATPETKATFDEVAGGAQAPVEAPPSGTAESPAAAAAVADPSTIPGDMICTPELRDIQTRMPLPISCTSMVDATEAVLKFKEFGSDQWKKMSMQKVGEYFQAEIPCDITSAAGPLQFYVGAKDASGEYVDQYGSQRQPATITLSETAAGPAPAFPGKEPVTRCAAESDCPPDFPGCGDADKETQCGDLDWGQSCKNSAECKCGLICDGGTCTSAPTCTTDEECSEGVCVDGYCSVPADAGQTGPFQRHWVGLDFGLDLTFMGGGSLCTPAQGESYGSYCYFADGTPYQGADVGIDGTGAAMGQLRAKLGYDFAITDKMQLGARVGFAFVNTPPAGTVDAQSGFFPVHGEARFTYNFTSLSATGLRPALYVGGGVAEVAGAVPASTVFGEVTVYKRAGIGLGNVGGSLAYAFAPNMAVKLDVNAMLLFGSYPFNFALHPSLGFVYGL